MLLCFGDAISFKTFNLSIKPGSVKFFLKFLNVSLVLSIHAYLHLQTQVTTDKFTQYYIRWGPGTSTTSIKRSAKELGKCVRHTEGSSYRT